MHLARHSITSTLPVQVFDARFDPDFRLFTCTTPAGFAVYQTNPLRLLRKHELTDATLAMALPLHSSSLLFLLGGGTMPLYPPNKIVLWDAAANQAVAELEFREKVRGMACRRGWLAVALRRRVVVFQINEQIRRHSEYETNENLRGIVALATATHSTLLAMPGRQLGHVQLVHLPPCPPPRLTTPTSGRVPLPTTLSNKNPVAIIVAHETALSTIAVTISGRLIATTSARGTLVRVWDAMSGSPIDSFRRGSDQAEIYSVAFRPDEKELCVCSDKGTVHVFVLPDAATSNANRVSLLSGLTPFLKLPKYFESKWSYAKYRLPAPSSHIALSSLTSSSAPLSASSDLIEDDRCVVGWIEALVQDATGVQRREYQLIALTYSGGWYRLGLPSPSAPPPSTPVSSRVATSPPASPKLRRASGDTGSPVRPGSPRAASVASSAGRGKGKEPEHADSEKEHAGSDCTLVEYRRFGTWDGWR
ncbi:WD40-repeat-containing domain protein [Auriculariales sp. MPI-PUGE-AT-0066]|nr:WD40-repeat-containing domain protein [Auriculariales sp. MPI-PUGE-AT-0066]